MRATEEMASQSITKSADVPEGLDELGLVICCAPYGSGAALLLVPDPVLASCKALAGSHPQNSYHAASNSPEDSSKGFAAPREAHAQATAAGEASLARDLP